MATVSGFDETDIPGRSVDAARTPERAILRNVKGKPAALIVCEQWETFLQGGVGGAVSLLAGLFQALGMVIFCTLLKTSPRINQEAKDLDISLKLPSMDARGRYTEPEPNWLPTHQYYYPKLGEIENVKMVVGFGMSTSDAAYRIRQDIFKDAIFHLVNLWDHDLLSEHSLGYSKDKFNTHCDFFREDSKVADVITSIGLEAHHDFSSKHGTDYGDKHFQIQTFPLDRYFKLSPPKLSDNGQVRILSFLEKCDIKELSNLLVLAKAINGVTETCINSFDSPPKWRIVGVPEGREEEIEKRLKPHAKLDIFCIPIQSLEQLEEELQCAHIVLIPPKALNSFNFALTAMAIGVPVYVPVRSQCHYFLKEYNMLDYERDVTVDMNGETKKLQEKIMYAIKKYSVVSKKSNQIKELLRTQVKQEVDKTNAEFVKELSKRFDNSVSKGCIEKRTGTSSTCSSYLKYNFVVVHNEVFLPFVSVPLL
ncbi:uncharacterized protein [Ptychodera flava]|uniref:uncharacterized protein n=1 Tax=Ptychodera flava TaxID=63121 RepID=UPI00396A0B09